MRKSRGRWHTLYDLIELVVDVQKRWRRSHVVRAGLYVKGLDEVDEAKGKERHGATNGY